MKVISIQGFKGGSAKSATAYHLACALAIRGARVLALDTDPQGNLTEMARLKLEPAFHDFMVREASYKAVLRVVEPALYTPLGIKNEGRLYVIPGDEETRTIAGQIADMDMLHYRLDDGRNMFDVVIIDTSPSPTLLHTSIYLASDYALFPTKCEWLHFDGLMRSIAFSDKAARQRHALGLGTVKRLGILPTMYRAKTLEHSDMHMALIGKFGAEVMGAIADRILWAEAARAHQPVFTYSPNSKAAADAWGIADEFQVRANVS